MILMEMNGLGRLIMVNELYYEEIAGVQREMNMLFKYFA